MMFAIMMYMSWLIVIPLVIMLYRYRYVTARNYPFLWLLIIGFINEIISVFSISLWHSNAVNSNLYILTESLIWAWLLFKWTKQKAFCLILASVFTMLWITDNIIAGTFFSFTGFYRAVYAAIMIILFTHQLHRQIMISDLPLLQNGRIWIITGALFYYSAKCLIEIFYLKQFNTSEAFAENIFFILAVANCLMNIMFIPAAICLSSKKKYSLRFS